MWTPTVATRAVVVANDSPLRAQMVGQMALTPGVVISPTLDGTKFECDAVKHHIDILCHYRCHKVQSLYQRPDSDDDQHSYEYLGARAWMVVHSVVHERSRRKRCVRLVFPSASPENTSAGMVSQGFYYFRDWHEKTLP